MKSEKDSLLLYDEVKLKTNQYVSQLFDKNIAAADEISIRYGNLWRSIYKLVDKGGKRIRPYLVNLAYRAFNGQENNNPIIAGVALELFHVALLIHDDIIDRDTYRYGIKNISGQYQSEYHAFISDQDDLNHYANSAALLAGDLLISEAYRLFNEINAPSENRNKAFGYFSKSFFEVCGGELLDVESSLKAEVTDSLTIAKYKTASYSFVGPLLIGASLAGASHKQQKIVKELGGLMGVSYQLKDDLLGIFGDESVTGKTTIGDIREGKQTFIVEEFYKLASPDDLKTFKRAFGRRGLSNQVYKNASQLLVKSGAKSICEKKINNLTEKALGRVDKLEISTDYKKEISNLVLVIAGRDK